MQRYVAIGIASLLVLVIGFVASSGVSDGDDEWEGRILYANLEFDEAAEISNRLRIMEVPHRLTPDATTILVPEDQYMDLRVTLAGEGFPKSGRIGYEIFDEAQLAMTDFLQQVNYQRALQSELEETLVRIDGVRDARVHLVIPEPSLFNEEQNPVTASVQLSLQRNIKLKPEPIEAIGYLVSASVEGLDIENVVITDDDGNLLSKEKDPLVKMASKQFEMQQQVERALEQKVQTLMDQVIGPGSSSIRINVELNFDRSDVTKEIFEPGAVVISEETNETSSAEQGTEEQAIRNYEVNRKIEHVVGGVGTVNRITMALTVDLTKLELNEETEEYIEINRPEKEFQELEKVAKEVVGFNQERGDKIYVSRLQFDKTDEKRAKIEADAEVRLLFWTDIAINGGKVVGIIAALVLLRVILQAIGRGYGVEEDVEVLGEVEGDIEEEEMIARAETPHDIILDRVKNLVHQRPEDAAKLIRTMLVEQST